MIVLFTPSKRFLCPKSFLCVLFQHVKRTGWVLKNIPDPECVAGHMHRMAMMTFLLDSSQSSLDKVRFVIFEGYCYICIEINLIRFFSVSRCMQLALVHDLAECIVGDITPNCGIDPEEKHRREDEAMKSLCDLAGLNGPHLYALYKVNFLQHLLGDLLVHLQFDNCNFT